MGSRLFTLLTTIYIQSSCHPAKALSPPLAYIPVSHYYITEYNKTKLPLLHNMPIIHPRISPIRLPNRYIVLTNSVTVTAFVRLKQHGLCYNTKSYNHRYVALRVCISGFFVSF